MLVLKVEDIPDEGLDLEWEEDRTSTGAYLANIPKIDFDFQSPPHSVVRVRKAARAIFIKGTIQSVLQLQCGRCLKGFSYPLASGIDLTLLPLGGAAADEEIELNEEEIQAGFYEAGEIRLSEIVFEQVFLEIPHQPVCESTCKGLCQICGANLNASSCGCMKKDDGSSFSVLQKLRFD